MNSFKKIINYSDLNVLDFHLPEYCEMFISGKCLTPAQAKEIIFKTDKIIEEIYKHSYFQKNKELSFWEKTLKMPLEAGCVLED